MDSPVLPAPEKLNGTKSCELAAILVTLGFTRVDDQMKVVQGEGVPGGRLGYWRFLPKHPQGCYKLDIVLQHGTDPMQARHAAGSVTLHPAMTGEDGNLLPHPSARGGETRTAGRQPVYMEQAYMAAVMHNKRLLAESVKFGTRLTLQRVGYLYVFQRVEAKEVPEMASAPVVRGLMAAGTVRTELAAALATLGFEPVGVASGAQAGAQQAGRTRVSHEGGTVTWCLPAVSADGRWNLQERMARWQDDAWCSRPENKDPIACMADCLWNLGHLRRESTQAHNIMVRVKNGGRSVLMPATASDAEWDKASDFLKGKR